MTIPNISFTSIELYDILIPFKDTHIIKFSSYSLNMQYSTFTHMNIRNNFMAFKYDGISPQGYSYHDGITGDRGS